MKIVFFAAIDLQRGGNTKSSKAAGKNRLFSIDKKTQKGLQKLETGNFGGSKAAIRANCRMVRVMFLLTNCSRGRKSVVKIISNLAPFKLSDTMNGKINGKIRWTAITDIMGREILDSRGNPTIEVDCDPRRWLHGAGWRTLRCFDGGT